MLTGRRMVWTLGSSAALLVLTELAHTLWGLDLLALNFAATPIAMYFGFVGPPEARKP